MRKSAKFKVIQNSASADFECEVQQALDEGFRLISDPTFTSTPNSNYQGKYVAFLELVEQK